MEQIQLEAEIRQEIGRAKVKDLLDNGILSAVVYSAGEKAQPIKFSLSQFLKLQHEFHLENAVINLKIKGDKKTQGRFCLIKEMQHDPVHGDIRHIDFHEISLTDTIKVNVPVVAKGEPVGVKLEGGSLEHIMWEIEIECLPMEIPKEITVDVSELKIGDAIHVREIAFPAGVKVLADQNAVVLSVAAPIKEEVPVEAVEGAETQEPEVIKEKKEVPAEGEEKPAKEGKEAKEEKK
ncbi:MAG: 50S ribosomal protein L25 [Candidatus Omnitrophica bacterium]|nr:50S ribosomal protein L25 [Candidatus Omnitrophota bacterium]